ncbi:MAG: hypothetical protein HY298_14740 [Verrucomicrobia bacterium]|nr:hypothetical protein [Verrucomicrobiota bacterium]
MQDQPHRRTRWRRISFRSVLALVALYLLLLLPESPPPKPLGAGKQPFAWNRDQFWSVLELDFQNARSLDRKELTERMDASLQQLKKLTLTAQAAALPSDAPVFDQLETNFFHTAPMVAANPQRLPEFLELSARIRSIVKRQSELWSMTAPATRERLYRALYGTRAAVEEVMLQAPRAQLQPLIICDNEPSTAPSAVVRSVTLHSGDILASRGGAATSALIARGNDFPGNFSHIALAHVDEQTKSASVIEAHIECGVVTRSIEAYLEETKLRVMLLRLRSNLPALVADPMLPHKAASLALSNALKQHIAYDFAMDYTDPTNQFCSEVASSAYQPFGVKLWMGLSHLSTPGVTAWLSALGVRHFETQEPSDLEYDPQLCVVAEWRDPDTLFKDHVDNAVIDVMLESAERGENLDYNRWLLPLVRLAKAWSVLLNWFGKVGPIPEGMNATTALRVDRLTQHHAAIQARVMEKAEQFNTERGYMPPYWELLRLAREAAKNTKP